MVTLLAFIVLLGVIITVHEAGHFIVAKLVGVKVEVFSIGFGKALLSKRIGETEYRISMLPLGGYVKMLGQMDEALSGEATAVDAADVGRALTDKPPLARIAIAVAGPVMNLLLPFVILVPYVTFSARHAEVTGAAVGAVDLGLPAGQAGLRDGDVIRGIDGEAIDTFWQVAKHIDAWGPEQGPLAMEIQRGDETLKLRITPEQIEHTNRLLNFTSTHNRIGYQPAFLAGDIVVVSGGAAAAAGLKSFDRVLEINGQAVAHYEAMRRTLAALSMGEAATVLVERETSFGGELPFFTRRDRVSLTYRGGEEMGLRHAGTCLASVDPEGFAGDALRRGDCILSVDGHPHTLAAFTQSRMTNRPGTERTLEVLRDGQVHEVPFKLTKVVFDDPLAGEVTQWRLGLVLAGLSRADTMVPGPMVPNVNRLGHGWYEAWRRVKFEMQLTLDSLGGMFSGRVSPTQLSGPLTIGYLAGKHAEAGVDAFLHLMVLLSLSVGLLNLLPVPVLDGGQVLVALVELVARRPLPAKFLRGLQTVGTVMVLALIVFALANDLIRMWRISSGG